VRVLSLIVVLLLAAPALADDKPWVNVSEQEQAAALALYEQGNAEFRNARFKEALALYEQAIAHWDHPAIRFNMAVSLNNLGRLLEANDNLDKSLQFGEEPLGHDIYVQGLNYRELFASRLARIQITCSEPGTKVSFDGKVLFVAPGESEQLVLPGEHAVVATKAGFLTASETMMLEPGKTRVYQVHLIALKSETVRVVRRWPAWQPWAVVASGVALAAIGGGFYHAASDHYATYDAGVKEDCPHGCSAAMAAQLGAVLDEKSRGDVERAVAISLLSAGGAAALVGLAGVLLDQPHAITERVVPAVAPGAVTVSARFTW
jgi:tetratricopeptide (TPR) repeat protein